MRDYLRDSCAFQTFVMVLKSGIISIGIVRIGIYRRKPVTGLCNESAIRLCAVDLPEVAKGAVKSDSGLRVYRELSRGSRGAREIYIFRSLFPQKTPTREFFATALQVRINSA
ncbi:hypothetical protein HY967_00660 [Candidatus Jorgensenbacteria bacterium]|nr:hypothetical protein [Candidatus Jorgensenbacteria bacterium]